MADNRDSKYSDAEITMILDTYMYIDYEYANDGETFAEIVNDMPKHIDVTGSCAEEYAILKDAASSPEIGDLKIGYQSQKMGYNSGTRAVTWQNERTNDIYVIFRGTADGEWMDNGNGMTMSMTPQQKDAVRYFDEVVESIGVTPGHHLVPGGHSKGGNKVQVITMESEYSYLIDKCYSIDGQGHSEEAIKMWKSRYSEEEYNTRVNKIYGINGQNDFVSVLGNTIIPVSNISYIKTEAKDNDYASFHDITAMFAKKSTDENGKEVITYSAHKNPYVSGRGKLGDYVSLLSEKIMTLPKSVRDGCCATAMQAVEIMNKNKLMGIHFEHATVRDIGDFSRVGAPVIVFSLLMSKEGNALLKSLYDNKKVERSMSAEDNVEVNYVAMLKEARSLKELASKIQSVSLGIEAKAATIPLYYDGQLFNMHKIHKETAGLEILSMKLAQMAKIQEKVANLYRVFDTTKIPF